MVDALVSIAVEKLNTILQDEVALLVGVANEIEKLSSTFTLIQAVLKDAETRRVKDEPVKVWMEKLKDVAYDVDDILDEWTTEALRSQEPDEDDVSCFSKKKKQRYLAKAREKREWTEEEKKEEEEKGFRMQNIPPEELQTPTETLELPVVGKGPMPSAQNDDSHDDNDGDDLWGEDGSFYNVSDDGSGKTSDLDREWERRHNQFHTIGYRDGLTAGKETSAQEGFVVGFKQSVLIGYKWGHVRGVSSALALLPDNLKEKLVRELETRERLQNLYESVHSISTKDALQLFHDHILGGGLEQALDHLEGNADLVTMRDDISGCSQLERFSKELESLLVECPSVEVHPAVD